MRPLHSVLEKSKERKVAVEFIVTQIGSPITVPERGQSRTLHIPDTVASITAIQRANSVYLKQLQGSGTNDQRR